MPSNNSHNEKELLSQVAAGDERAFRELLDAYGDTVYKYVFRITHEHILAEETVQDVFLQLWQTRELLAKVENFGGYLRIVARNCSLNALKRMLRQKSLEVQWKGEPESLVEDNPYRELLDAAINNLPPQQQRAWILHRQLRKTYAEISEEMGLSRETVKKYLQTATQSVTDYLQQHKVAGAMIAIFLLQ